MRPDLVPAEFGLIPGGDAGSDAILKAEAEIVRRLKEEGRPLAAYHRPRHRRRPRHRHARRDARRRGRAVAGYGPTTVSRHRDDGSGLHRLCDRAQGRKAVFAEGSGRGARPAAGTRRLLQRDGEGGDGTRRQRPDPDRGRGQRTQAALLRRRRHRFEHGGAGRRRLLGPPQPVRPRRDAAHRRVDRAHRRRGLSRISAS